MCGSEEFQLLYSFAEFHVIRCRRCELVSTTLSPDRLALEEMYSSAYYQNRSQYYFQNSVINQTATKENSNIRDFRRGLSLIEQFKNRGRLLDVGCALGVFLSLARERGWEAYGVDLSQYAASYAKEVLKLDVSPGDLEDARFPDEWFDVITLWDVLEHFPDPTRQLREVRRILKDDGIVLLNTPNEAGLLRVLASTIFRLSGGTISYPVRKLYHPFHFHYFTPRTFLSLLEKVGFVLIQLEKRCIPIVKARGRPFEQVIVKMLSWPERISHKEYELLAIARKQNRLSRESISQVVTL